MLLGTVGNSLMKDVYIIINHDRGAILGTQGTLSWVLGSLQCLFTASRSVTP